MNKSNDIKRIQVKELTVRGCTNPNTDISIIICYNNPIKHLATIIKVDGEDKIKAILDVSKELLRYAKEKKTNAQR